MPQIDNEIETLLLYKANLMKRKYEQQNSKYLRHLKDIINELNIRDPVKAAIVGAVDAMIYDVACTLDFTKNKKGTHKDWSSYQSRKDLLIKIFKK